MNNLRYKIALSMIPGIGGVLARNLVAYTGSVEAVFSEPVRVLKKIPGIGDVNARRIRNEEILRKADKELLFIEKHNIATLFYTDSNFPRRLKSCVDAPVLIYTRGDLNLDEQKVLSIVGTRNATDYGRSICEELIRQFSERNHKVLIVSGLAYGIDVHAHKSALKYGIQTVGVVAHGFDRLYPSLHAEVARKMQDYGGLVTDFPSGTRIDPSNFVRRNRIIAGLADATLVVESAKKGGALITADIASSYNRDVFAFPGRTGDTYSSGCNQLIRNNGANLIENIDDIEFFMGWEKKTAADAVQQPLFVELTKDEEKLVNLLRNNGEMFIDQLSDEMAYPVSKVSSMLLSLEFKNVVVALPGMMYRLR
ncbi:MAG: DNA-protecting protein DprA [Draconibacterium sp.]|nr:MAG: DNA-protecting protein DprA [Draconibacterium sp.]